MCSIILYIIECLKLNYQYWYDIMFQSKCTLLFKITTNEIYYLWHPKFCIFSKVAKLSYLTIVWVCKHRKVINFMKIKATIRLDTCCCFHAGPLLLLCWLVLTQIWKKIQNPFQKWIWKAPKIKEKGNSFYFSLFPHFWPERPARPPLSLSFAASPTNWPA